ncbi:MAG TPA: DUF4296 domain-containing protein [Candidatus Coprenecus stercoravium]|uniref:DUF4296 domain-containing protein n=1 Tax=Candidatus Coprenecus stercoravium TaxID=2840735 RepID=A0A9D2KAL8_9BACT|nr:DUF4296 domain-containing protein [Candidatus Coprenecus stercoravium]
MSKKTLLYLLLTAVMAASFSSCDRKRQGIIPKEVMSEIYYDIYLTDEAVRTRYTFRKMADTMRIYESIFNKYGYTTGDYNRSVEFYLERPDKFEDVFVTTKEMLEKRKAELNLILEAEGKRPRYWPLIDSMELYTSEGIHSPRAYKNFRMMFFKPDTTAPMSPIPDTAFMKRPGNPFAIYNDSALNADKHYEFYAAKEFMSEIRDYVILMDSLTVMAAKAAEAADTVATENSDTTDIRKAIEKPRIKHKSRPVPVFIGKDPVMQDSLRNRFEIKKEEK